MRTLEEYHALTLTHGFKSHPQYTPFAADIEIGIVMVPGRSVHRAGLSHQPIVSHECNGTGLHRFARKFRRWGIEDEILHVDILAPDPHIRAVGARIGVFGIIQIHRSRIGATKFN